MRSFFRVISVILLVAWMSLIFVLSNQNADTSSQTSGQVIEIIAEKFYPEFSQMDETQKQEVISSLQFVARKTAHAAMFAVLGLLAFLTFISYVNLSFLTRSVLATGVGALYAASDEIHQIFVPGRSCELRDFLIDFAGVLTAVLISVFFVKIIGPLRRKTEYEGVSKRELKELNCELYEKLDVAEYHNQKLKNEVAKHKKTIEELELALQSKNTITKPENPVFTEPLIEVEKVIENPPEADVFETCEQTEISEKTQFETDEEMAYEIEAQLPMDEPENYDEKEQQMKLDSQMNYAAKVIGESVVEVTKVCNKITETISGETEKELVNLALGRCEVLKSEILKIMSRDMSFEDKKNLIEKERKETFDYFDSIIAQMN